MRVNQENKSVDMESRDINYILPAYVRSYLFYNKNEMPEKIIFPMFPSVLVQGKDIPIEYVPPLDPVAVEIAQDGAEVAEVTEEQEAVLDEKDEEIKRLKADVEGLTSQLASGPFIATDAVPDDSVSPARAAFAEPEPSTETIVLVPPKGTPPGDAEAVPTTPPPPAPSVVRQPKQPPGGDIGPGSALSDMQARDRRDQVRTAKDLVDEPDINEAEEKEYEKPISRDDEGRPLVEDKMDMEK